ncbi:hypothetical protein K492DRAFT_146430 [Lichtheimia hyalospora FSU 10163]|nr:hypothetical protein K492DRAFT_146430 [Lichtheimia hyalospora FSU 10163]
MPSVGGSAPLQPTPPNGMYNVLMTGNTGGIPTASSSANLNGTSNSGEEISTIFVVGFPDDMQEREFQNMFIFSPGFEAATLKIPTKDQEEDIHSNGNGTSNNNNRKQIIGFAKFRTRYEALEAKDILSGRRVDAEKGSVLKAEMAKKNLHTKRGLSTGDQQQQQQLAPQHPMSTTSHPLTSTQQQHGGMPKRFSLSPGQSAYEAFHSVPAALPNELHPPSELSYPELYPDLFSPGGTPITSTFNDSVFASRAAAAAIAAGERGGTRDGFDARSASMGDIFNHRSMSSSHSTSRLSMNRFSNNNDNDRNNSNNLYHSSTSLLSPTATLQTTAFSSPFSSPPTSVLNSVHEEMYPLQLPSQLLPQTELSDHEEYKQQGGAGLVSALNSRLAGLTINTTPSSTTTNNGGLPSPGVSSPTGFLSFAAAGSSSSNNNNATTIVNVHNLPNNANEEEMIALFSQCIGYQRLLFRPVPRPGSPVCLVEFNDTACANRAVQELYGTMLSNSVNSGIRLSINTKSNGMMGIRQAPPPLDSFAGRLEHHHHPHLDQSSLS